MLATTLIVILVVLPLVLAAISFLLGFRLGGEHWQSQLTRTRLEAVQAERQLHDLTRQAFVAMAEHAEPAGRRRHQSS